MQGGFLRPARRGFTGDQPVEWGLPANHTVNQFLQEAAVGGTEACLLKRRIKEVFNIVLAGLPLEEQAAGNFSWFFIRSNFFR